MWSVRFKPESTVTASEHISPKPGTTTSAAKLSSERLIFSQVKTLFFFFQLLNKVEEGTYGVVYRAIERKTKEIVALKRLKMEKEKEGFPITSLREINTLLISQHPNVVTVREIVVGSDMDRIYIG